MKSTTLCVNWARSSGDKSAARSDAAGHTWSIVLPCLGTGPAGFSSRILSPRSRMRDKLQGGARSSGDKPADRTKAPSHRRGYLMPVPRCGPERSAWWDPHAHGGRNESGEAWLISGNRTTPAFIRTDGQMRIARGLRSRPAVQAGRKVVATTLIQIRTSDTQSIALACFGSGSTGFSSRILSPLTRMRDKLQGLGLRAI